MSVHWTPEEYQAHLRRDQPDPLPALTEDAWQAAVLRVLKDAGFMAYHTHA